MSVQSNLIKQIIFFLFVGGVTFLIDVLVTYVLFHFLHFPAYTASAIGFLSGFFFNFPMNRKKVFHHSEKDKFTLKAQIVFYILLSLFNLVVTSLIVELLVGWTVEIQIAKLFVTILIATWNFLIFKFFVFSKKLPTNT